jgi:cell filamentation protein, protein adenylyltransferase
MSDPYLDPRSGILRNKFGLSDQESLDRAESNSVSVRSILLQLNPLKSNFDSAHLQAIHSYLFRDVYEWAGQFRTIPLARAEDVRGGRIVRFTPPDLIEQELKQVFDGLANQDFLEGLSRKEFACNMAGERETAGRSGSSCVSWPTAWDSNCILK